MTIQEKLDVLAKIARELNRREITWGVGASLLMYFDGIVTDFHDIDLMTTAHDALRLRDTLATLGQLQPPHPAAAYRTGHFYEFVIDGVDVDAMADFVIVQNGQAFSCPFDADSIEGHITVFGEDIPLQSLSEWQRYYTLMGRTEKAAWIGQYLAVKAQQL